MTLLIAAVVFMQTLVPQPAYVLDHPTDENLLILATSDGRYPIALLSGSCGWVHSDMNVHVDQVQDAVAHISAGPNDQYGDLSVARYGCVVAIGDGL
jgi:hypothetical protein